MKKLQVNIPKEGVWGTVKTKYPSSSDLVSYDELTNGSKNFETVSNGSLVKRLGGVNYNSTTFTGAPKDQYEAIFTDGTHHLIEVSSGVIRFSSGGGTFTDVTSGYSSNANFEFSIYNDRLYGGNGVDSPQVYDRATTYGGVSYTAPKTKVMGAQAPTSAVTFAADTAGGNVPAGGHTYKVTFLYYDFEESNGGPVSALRTVANPNNTVNITAVPIGGYGVTARKIYRDNNDGNWLLVGTVNDNTTTTFADTASTGTTVIPVTNNVPPTFRYIVTHLDRNWIAGVSGDPSSIYFSDAGLPDIFPGANRILCNPRDPIVALYVYNDTVWILNRNSLGKIVGRTKDTFRYSEIPSSVGCVDNRSIQVITNEGIPTLIWLSDKGIYGSNGSSVNYLSDAIEDLVNLNIQQATQVKGQNAQTTQAQFDAGTKTPAITTTAGVISVANPKRVWDDEADWEGGSSLTNIATNNTTNQLRVPTKFEPALSLGTYSNTEGVTSIKLPVATDFTGSSRSSTITATHINSDAGATGANRVACKFRPTRTGTLTGFTASQITATPGVGIGLTIWTDSGGLPSAQIADFGIKPGGFNVNWTGSVVLTGNTTYWFVFTNDDNIATNSRLSTAFCGAPEFDSGTTNTAVAQRVGSFSPSALTLAVAEINPGVFINFGSIAGSYTYIASPVATSGIWTSQTYDSLSDSAVAGTLTNDTSLPAGTTLTSTVEATNDPNFLTGIISQSFVDLDGTTAVSLSGKRYWRVKYTLSTTDDRITPEGGTPVLTFATTGTWISEVIDHTTDITALSSLSFVTSTPSGTSATLEIATSADNMTYSSFTSLGSAVVQRYSKIRITLTTNGSNTVTPTVTSALFTWAISANIQSSAIDTGTVPAGWDIFQSSFVTNGGTVTFHLRTATTSGGLSSATYVAITNGQFPTNTPLQFAQWKVTITAAADSVPTVDSVTLNWFISSGSSIRVASLFYNRSYYLAAAEYNQTTNNVMIVLDANGMWRVYRGISASTMGMFFNDPYYGSSTEGRIIRFLQGLTDQGTAIEMIVDTKAMDFGDEEHTKILKKIYLSGVNTGGVYQPQFSLDDGLTFNNMVDIQTGSSTYTSTSDGSSFIRRFQPNFEIGQPTAAKTIMLRVKESTSAAAEISSIKAEVMVRTGDII